MKLLLLFLALVSACNGQDWKRFCQGKPCPKYTVTDTNLDGDEKLVFEERLYDPTDWITTKVEGNTAVALLAARSRLSKVPGYADSWPVLISVKDGSYWLSWFLRPGTEKPEFTDSSVTLLQRPKGTVYVRVFGGTPSIESGQANVKILCDALHAAGKPCKDRNTYIGAGYDSFFSITHHDEVWIDQENVSS